MNISPKLKCECRILTAAELPGAVRTIINECPEIPYFAEKNPERLIQKWLKFMASGMAYSYGAFCGDKVIGGLLGLVSEDLLSETSQAMECVWQVIPAYRKTGVGMELLRMFEEDSRKAGCARVIFGAACSFEYEKMCRLYRRLGYKPISLGFAKDF